MTLLECPASVGVDVQSPLAEPDRPAIVDRDGWLTHSELAVQVASVADQLPPVSSGRRLVHVPLAAERRLVIGYLSVLRAGHVALVTAPGDRSVPAAYSPDLTLDADGSFRAHSDWPQHLLHPELALLLSTSGSTGSPKLVRLSAGNVLSNADAIGQALAITPADRAVTALPLHYCFGLSVLHAQLRAGATTVLRPEAVLAGDLGADLARHRVSLLPATPHVVDLLDAQGVLDRPLPALRLLLQAGGAMAPDRVRAVARRGRAAGWQLVVMYGQTEATARMAVLPPALTETHPDAVGWPVPGSTVRVADSGVARSTVRLSDLGGAGSAGRRTPDAGGERSGELVFSGPGVMLGYAEHPDDLALGRMIDELPTGDLARIDSSGLIRIVGRRSGFVKIAGLRIDLSQVERGLGAEGIQSVVTGTDARLEVTTTAPDGHPVRTRAAELAGVGPALVSVVSIDAFPMLLSGKPDRQASAGLHGATATAAPAPTAPPQTTPGQTTPAQSPPVQTTKLTETRTNGVPRARQGAGRRPDGVAAPASNGRQRGPRRRHPARVSAPADDLLARVCAALGPLTTYRRVDPERSFAELGGDSFSHVEASVRLGRLLGVLPPDWQHRPVGELVAQARPGRPGRWWRPMETTVVLRAVAALTICGSHVNLFRLEGGAHVLFAVAGFLFASYVLTAPPQLLRRRAVRAVLGVAVPALAVFGVLFALFGSVGWSHLLLMHWLVQPQLVNGFWFIEALLLAMVTSAALLQIPVVRHSFAADPWRAAMLAFCLLLVPRYLLVGVIDAPMRIQPYTVGWLFAAGAAMSLARTGRQRWITALAASAAVIGFYPSPVRDGLIMLGLTVLALVPRIPVPRLLVRPLGVLAAASLHIYLVQFQVFSWFEWNVACFVVAVTAGVAYWGLCRVGVAGLANLREVDLPGVRALPLRRLVT